MGLGKDVWLKIGKDFGMGLLAALAPWIMGMTGGAAVSLTVVGVLLAVLKVGAGVVSNDLPRTNDTLKIVGDMLGGFLVAAIGFLQGADVHAKAFYILAGLGVCLLSTLANVLHDDWAPATAFLKIVKDCIYSASLALCTALTAGLSAGTALTMILATAGIAMLSALGNTLEADIFGMSSATPLKGPIAAPATPPAGNGGQG